MGVQQLLCEKCTTTWVQFSEYLSSNTVRHFFSAFAAAKWHLVLSASSVVKLHAEHDQCSMWFLILRKECHCEEENACSWLNFLFISWEKDFWLGSCLPNAVQKLKAKHFEKLEQISQDVGRKISALDVFPCFCWIPCVWEDLPPQIHLSQQQKQKTPWAHRNYDSEQAPPEQVCVQQFNKVLVSIRSCIFVPPAQQAKQSNSRTSERMESCWESVL